VHSRSGRARSARRTPTFAAGLNNLAALYQAQSFESKAEPLLVRALGIRERALDLFTAYPASEDLIDALDHAGLALASANTGVDGIVSSS
jgi:hypothetical protein